MYESLNDFHVRHFQKYQKRTKRGDQAALNQRFDGYFKMCLRETQLKWKARILILINGRGYWLNKHEKNSKKADARSWNLQNLVKTHIQRSDSRLGTHHLIVCFFIAQSKVSNFFGAARWLNFRQKPYHVMGSSLISFRNSLMGYELNRFKMINPAEEGR